MRKKLCGIYMIINDVSGDYYIGSSSNIQNRWHCHARYLRMNKHGNQKLQNSYNKYGVKAFSYEVVELCDKEELVEREQLYLDIYFGQEGCFNLLPTAYSPLGRKHSQETKEKMRQAALGSKNHFYGKKHSQESLDKMSIATSGKNNPRYGMTGEKNPRFGKHITEEHKQKLQAGYLKALEKKRAIPLSSPSSSST